jgi:cyclase
MKTWRSLAASAAALALAACATTPADDQPAPAQVADAPKPAQTPAPPAGQFASPPANTLAFNRVVDLGAGISMLMGQGGNMALIVGEDGALLIDDQYATNAQANLAKIEELAKGKPKYLINTHWHGDHAGGNEVIQSAGATVFAHENVRKRISGAVSSVNRTGAVTPPSPQAAWPVVTFVDGVDFHLNGQTIRAFSVGPAHTDGDVMVYFAEADVLHMGDTYMKGLYPFVDTGSGGRQAGFISALKTAIEVAGPDTKVIPGHGELASEADLVATLAMHEGARAAVEARVKAGDTLAEAVAAKPLKQWTPTFGKGFINEDVYATVIYNELKAR